MDEDYVTRLMQNFGISDLLARLLSTRTSSLDEVIDFLSPKLKNLLPDPFHLIGMQKGVGRTVEAINLNQKICIFADYDVDGATSSALLKNVLKNLGVEADIYVPDRIAEGYGPSAGAMEKIKASGTDLVITVDCGAMAHEALEHAKAVGLDVIVIDHHISSDILPEAVAIINPNRIDETSNYGYLAAVGVSYLFAIGLVSELKKSGYFANRPIPDLLEYLDLVALGTVCDVMPIRNLNRAFVLQGLKVMLRRRNIGIRTLLDIARIEERPTCYHLGFVLGPRINAGGRVGKSSLGANLLSTDCEREAEELAKELDMHNNERKVIELMILDEALRIAEQQVDNPMLFITGENWHPGVIGIVAGRVKEKFNKPVAVVAINNGVGKASCRSITGIDFGGKLIEAKQLGLIIAGGGHAMAAGFTAEALKLPELQRFLNRIFAGDFANLSGDNIEEYHAELTGSSINSELMEELDKLEPYGNHNPEPIFKFSNLFVLRAEIMVGKHIKCLLAPSKESYGRKPINAVAFNAVSTPIETVLLSKRSNTVSVIGSLKANFWQGQRRIQLHIKDVIVAS